MPDRVVIPATLSIDPALLGGTSSDVVELLADVRRVLLEVRKRLDESGAVAVGEARAAELLDVSPSLLAQLRSRGEGPPHRRLGSRVVYPLDGLRRWVNERAEEAVPAGVGAEV